MGRHSGETKELLKLRLISEGRWLDYVARRTALVKSGQSNSGAKAALRDQFRPLADGQQDQGAAAQQARVLLQAHADGNGRAMGLMTSDRNSSVEWIERAKQRKAETALALEVKREALASLTPEELWARAEAKRKVKDVLEFEEPARPVGRPKKVIGGELPGGLEVHSRIVSPPGPALQALASRGKSAAGASSPVETMERGVPLPLIAPPAAVEIEVVRSIDEEDSERAPVAERKRCSEREVVQWVFDHLEDKTVGEKDAPSQGAWGLLANCQRNMAVKETFLQNIWPKLLPTRNQMEVTDRFTDDGRDVLELIERIKQIKERNDEESKK